MSDTVGRAVAALRRGELVILSTDTVYGLAATADREDAVRRLYRLKGRAEIQPTAIMAASVDRLLAMLPELSGRSAEIAEAVLPGPFTLVLPNPSQHFHWLNGARPDAIGVRVPSLGGPSAAVLEQIGAIVATSANLAGQPDPCSVDDIPEELQAGVAAVIDGGRLPGVPSTVIDVTGPKPLVLRRGAGDVDEALMRIYALSE